MKSLPEKWTIGPVVDNENSPPVDRSMSSHCFCGYCLEDYQYHWYFVPKLTPPRAIIGYFCVGDPERGLRGEAPSIKTEQFADTLVEISTIAPFLITKAAPFECNIEFSVRLNMGLLRDIQYAFTDYDDKEDAGLVDYIIATDGIQPLLQAVLNENRIQFRWEID